MFSQHSPSPIKFPTSSFVFAGRLERCHDRRRHDGSGGLRALPTLTFAARGWAGAGKEIPCTCETAVKTCLSRVWARVPDDHANAFKSIPRSSRNLIKSIATDFVLKLSAIAIAIGTECMQVLVPAGRPARVDAGWTRVCSGRPQHQRPRPHTRPNSVERSNGVGRLHVVEAVLVLVHHTRSGVRHERFQSRSAIRGPRGLPRRRFFFLTRKRLCS